ncbi:MAG TPA: hypothetical protein EYP86_02935 [Candidatus Altiarchaeales archaeon]|nr:hypothetical protein [Candidatus Altiarchaeales archaeon]
MNDRYITEDRIGVSFLLHVPKAKKEVDYYTKNYSALKETLWFYPVDDEPCKIYLDDRLIQRVIPRSNC